MIDVLKAFYSVHYNFGILAIIILLIGILFATKKMWIFLAITVVIVLVMNVAFYKMTDGKSWTIEPAVVKTEFGETKGSPMTFDVKKNWVNEEGVIVDRGDTIHHWCWVDQIWENFSETDVIGALWGENKSKKMIKASESHGEGVGE
ncbi:MULTISPECIES: hypothetical protein [unclassified Fibrobacter]|jgi:hypothetical protein|uniref:hypothetical protein n=1 Tax=unclassified Fibrobacter TaxID=2634177 RepID=UPI001563A349|nr:MULTISPECIES: hypothetical protein [unclassified Fibrobacter]